MSGNCQVRKRCPGCRQSDLWMSQVSGCEGVQRYADRPKASCSTSMAVYHSTLKPSAFDIAMCCCTQKFPPPVPILSPTQSILSHPTSWRSVLLLSSHLCLGLPNCLFPSRFPLLNLIYASPLTHTRYMPRPSHSSRFYQTKTEYPQRQQLIKPTLFVRFGRESSQWASASFTKILRGLEL